MAKFKATNVGITINTDWIELAQLSKDGRSIEKFIKMPIPMATIDASGDKVIDTDTLATSIAAMVAELGHKASIKLVHLSVPGTLVRIVEMPKVPKNELYLALISEAERYAIFNDTEAIVDYEILSEEPDEKQKILLVALRKDTVTAYKEIFNLAKLKIASLEVEILSSLRGLKTSGALNKVLSEINDQPWGTIHFESDRIRIGLWQYDQIKNWREVLLDTTDLKSMGEDAPVVQDLIEEIRRTIGMTRPVLWLTYGINDSMAFKLTSRIGATVKPMLPGEDIALLDDKTSLSAIGVCTKSIEAFPASINIQDTQSPESSSGLQTSFIAMIAIAGILAVLVGLITMGLFGFSFVKGQELKKLQEENNTIQTKIVELGQTSLGGVSQELVQAILTIKDADKTMYETIVNVEKSIPNDTWVSKLFIQSTIPIGVVNQTSNTDSTLPQVNPLVNSIKKEPPDLFAKNTIELNNKFKMYCVSYDPFAATKFIKELNKYNCSTLARAELEFLKEVRGLKLNYNFGINTFDWSTPIFSTPNASSSPTAGTTNPPAAT